jgi:hypothetical protein
MRETIGVHCPRCGVWIETYIYLDHIDYLDGEHIKINWSPAVVDHKCRWQDALPGERDTRASLWDDAGNGVLKVRPATVGGRPIDDVHLPANP